MAGWAGRPWTVVNPVPGSSMAMLNNLSKPICRLFQCLRTRKLVKTGDKPCKLVNFCHCQIASIWPVCHVQEAI